MNVIEAISGRFSHRAFLEKPVPESLIKEILSVARFAPSGVNTQPWHVAVVGPKHRRLITDAILDAKARDVPQNPDYDYYPKEWHEPYKSRRKACGLAMYGALNIQKEDMEKRKAQWYKNYHFFDAPAGFIFYIESKLCKGSWMDMGMFLENIMIAARHFGLETCPQAALAEYPDIIRDILNITKDYDIVCGMALGYPDLNHPINQYRTDREPLENFTKWYD